MRWSTAPRLTLELALVRAALPETDPQPAALLARLERLERLAGLPAQRDEPSEPPSSEAQARPSLSPITSSGGSDVSTEADDTSDEAPSSSKEAHAPDAGAVDAQMLRRAWPQVVEALKARRRMVLFANAQVATVGTFDGSTLELVFPPGREFGARKIEQKQGDLREVLSELFGISPTVRCTVREGTVPEPESDEPPASPEAAEDLLRRQFGAEVVEE
jgi:DNA polymerase-3 subunit gamma/tau